MLWNEIYRILSMEVDVKAVCQEVTDTRTLIVSLFLEIELCFTDPHLRQFSTVFAYVLYIRSIDAIAILNDIIYISHLQNTNI